MNWTSFLLTLTLAYLAYYGLNLLYDMFMSRRSPKSESDGDTLFFEEHVQPEIIEYTEEPVPDPEPENVEPPQSSTSTGTAQGISGNILSTGAVGLAELFNLAKNNLIEHTGTIPY